MPLSWNSFDKKANSKKVANEKRETKILKLFPRLEKPRQSFTCFIIHHLKRCKMDPYAQ